MVDNRATKLAEILVNYGCKVEKGEKVLIEAFGVDYMLVNEIIKKVYEVGGYPFVNFYDNRVNRELLKGETEEYAKLKAKYLGYIMQDMNCYIGIRGGNNVNENADISESIMQIDREFFCKPVHHGIRIPKTRWVVLHYPNEGMACQANMSTEGFEDFYYNVCTLDYAKMSEKMEPLVNRLLKADKVRIVAPNTDISFSIKGIGARKCAGRANIPDGEVYTAPIKDSVNGTITYNTASIQDGFRFENVSLTFKDGKIIKATANDTEKINKIFDTDEGARYVGEFSFGLNPYITKGMGDILFDEKISGSIHFTPGCCYKSCDNGNQSAIHWDLVLIQTKEYGGGEIYLDGELIRKDGLFVVDDLKGLNPENLK